jgi:hypothetical protein
VRTAELRLAWTGNLADMISSQRRATPHIIDVPPLEWWWMDLARKLPARHGTAGDYQNPSQLAADVPDAREFPPI